MSHLSHLSHQKNRYVYEAGSVCGYVLCGLRILSSLSRLTPSPPTQVGRGTRGTWDSYSPVASLSPWSVLSCSSLSCSSSAARRSCRTRLGLLSLPRRGLTVRLPSPPFTRSPASSSRRRSVFGSTPIDSPPAA